MRQRYCKKIETKKSILVFYRSLVNVFKEANFFRKEIKPFASSKVRKKNKHDKIMNKQVVLLIVFLSVNLACYAQGSEGISKRGNQREMIEAIMSDLDLDDLQEVSFKRVMRQSMSERKSLRDQDLSQEEIRESLKSISDKQNDELAKILHEDQYKEFLLLKSEMREKARKQRNGDGKKRN